MGQDQTKPVGNNDIKFKGVDLTENDGTLTAFNRFANRTDGTDKGNNKIEFDDFKAKGNKKNLNILNDFAQRGRMGESGKEENKEKEQLQQASN
ncbi:hypothetical protein Pyn_28086 [Prunus yedoensis var. nudiflora]|uniref:Uncharacterized protein n=1 Tax=Prunus yedoensis var. nudiflora TaxID=2094558 RepID=A0A314XRW2_PRUYE|nr:hypothetical protein Pyn_28086 [Prunus yedoensis var. nudiflora]